MKFTDGQVVDRNVSDEKANSGMTLWLVRPEDKHLYSLNMFADIKHAMEEAAVMAISTDQDWPEAIASAEAMARPYMTMNPGKPLFLVDNEWAAFRVDIVQPAMAAEEFTAVAIMVKDSGKIVMHVVKRPDNAPSDWHEITITMLLRHYFNIRWLSPSQMMNQIAASTTGDIVGTLRYRV